MVKHWSGGTYERSTKRAIEKITAASPHIARNDIENTTLFHPPSKEQGTIEIEISDLQDALNNKKIIGFDYPNKNNELGTHIINPICAAFFGPSWLLVGWSETENNFQNFKLENMQNLVVTDMCFETPGGASLQDFVLFMQARGTQSNTSMTGKASAPHPGPAEYIPDQQTHHAD